MHGWHAREAREAKRLASTKAKEGGCGAERLNDTLESNPQAWSLADKAAKKMTASAAMAATKVRSARRSTAASRST